MSETELAWAASKTATVYAALALIMWAAIIAVAFAWRGLFWLLEYAATHFKPWQIGAVALGTTVMLIWVVVFVGTFCCGVPR